MHKCTCVNGIVYVGIRVSSVLFLHGFVRLNIRLLWCVYMCGMCAWGLSGQNGTDAMTLELQIVVNWYAVLAAKPTCSARAASALATEPSLQPQTCSAGRSCDRNSTVHWRMLYLA